MALSDLCLQLAVEVFFVLFVAVIRWCVALDDGDVYVPALQSRTNQSAADGFPFQQASLQAFLEDDGNSLIVLVIVSPRV